MTISITNGGPMLCLSPRELPTGQPLTDETLLPLVCRALARQGQALPLRPELEVFPGRKGILVFVRSRLSPAEREKKLTDLLC